MANIFHGPTLWRGRGAYAARQALRQLGARWSAADNGWWLPALSMAERQVAEQLRYRWRREIIITPLPPGTLPPHNLSQLPDPDLPVKRATDKLSEKEDQ